ncbi:MAG: DedA family protein [Terriglobia bacterium]
MSATSLEFAGHFITSVISALGYPGVLVLMAIESACIPIPSEVIMTFSGYLVFLGRFKLEWVAVVGALGCNAGSIVAYWVGVAGGRPLVERYGRYIWLSKGDLERADRWFARYGDWTVFFARLLPVVRTFIALPAGVSRMNFLRFNIYTFLGSLPWCWVLAYAGMKLGANWDRLAPYFHRFDKVFVAACIVIICGLVYYRWRNRIRDTG